MRAGVSETGSIPSLSECDPGLRPMEFNVLILPEAVEGKTKGGIILPDEVKDADKAAANRGLLVAVSPVAFDFAEFRDVKPQVGDHVWYARYAGTKVKGRDGREYVLCKDRDIGAVIEPAEPADIPTAANWSEAA